MKPIFLIVIFIFVSKTHEIELNNDTIVTILHYAAPFFQGMNPESTCKMNEKQNKSNCVNGLKDNEDTIINNINEFIKINDTMEGLPYLFNIVLLLPDCELGEIVSTLLFIGAPQITRWGEIITSNKKKIYDLTVELMRSNFKSIEDAICYAGRMISYSTNFVVG